MESKDNRIDQAIKWILPFLLTLVVGYQQTQQQELKQTQKELESRVLILYTDKVSKTELKDTEDRITKNIEALKSDIIARLDLYFKKPN